MRYTIRGGAERPFSERAKESFRYLLPLLVILAGVLFLTLHRGANDKKVNPLTLGVYTIKSHDSPSSNTNKDSNNDGSASPDLSGSMAATTVSPISSGSANLGTATAVPAATGSTGGIIGGMGGGGTGGGGGGSGGGPTSIVTCDNTGGIQPITCTACTPPLVVLVGQKVLLSNSGSCSLLN